MEGWWNVSVSRDSGFATFAKKVSIKSSIDRKPTMIIPIPFRCIVSHDSFHMIAESGGTSVNGESSLAVTSWDSRLNPVIPIGGKTFFSLPPHLLPLLITRAIGSSSCVGDLWTELNAERNSKVCRIRERHSPPPSLFFILLQPLLFLDLTFHATMYAMEQERAHPVPPPPPPLSMDRISAPSAYPTPGSGPLRSADHLAPVSTIHEGRIWSLQVVQQPIRARMCGFGDKVGFFSAPCVRACVV